MYSSSFRHSELVWWDLSATDGVTGPG